MNTRERLAQVRSHLDESIGLRGEESVIPLSPRPSARDVGRRPLRKVGSVEIDLVVTDAGQPREEFSEDGIERLARSIAHKGQLLPIHVRWSEDHGKWIVISGERRYRAAKRAGMSTVDCVFHEEEMNESEVLEQQLIENLLREDLKPIEEARGFASLMELNGWNGKDVAEYLHLPPSSVSRALALLRLPAEIQQRVESGEIASRAAYEISKLDSVEQQRALAQKAADGVLSIDQTSRAVRQRRGQPIRRQRGTRLTFKTEAGWRVVVSGRSEGGYRAVEAALVEVLDEIRIRIENDIRLD